MRRTRRSASSRRCASSQHAANSRSCFGLGGLEPTLEGRHAGQVGAVLQLLQFLAQLHLLQEKLRILHRSLQGQLVTTQGQQVQGPARSALQGLVGLVQLRRAFQGETLLALGSVGETVGMDAAHQLAIALAELVEIDQESRLQVELGEMTGFTHAGLRR